MDPSILSHSDGYSTPWFVSLVDELVLNLHQSYPNANWSNLPPLTSNIYVAEPQALYVRDSCTTQGNSNGNTNGNGNGNGNGSGSGSGNKTVLIGAVAGAVGGCLLIAGLLFFFYRRHIKRKHAAAAPVVANAALLDSTPITGGKAYPTPFQGGPMPLVTPPSTYVPSSSGDASSHYNMPVAPQWTGATGYLSTSSAQPSSYFPTSGPHTHSTSSSNPPPPPWAVPLDPNAQPLPQPYMSQPNVGPGPSLSPAAMEKAQFSGYAPAVNQDSIPAWAVDHKNPAMLSRPSNSAGPSGSGTQGSVSNALEQPGDALPPPAYTATVPDR